MGSTGVSTERSYSGSSPDEEPSEARRGGTVQANGQSELVIRYWNVGGMRRNFPEIMESVKECDVAVFVEAFLSEDGLRNFAFPPGYLIFSNPAIRSEANARTQKGRSAGGIVLLAKANLFNARLCSSESIGPSILATTLTFLNGEVLELVGVYRVESEKSPVHDASFYESLTNLCVSKCSQGRDLMVVGDFNAKIGDSNTDLGNIEEFTFLLPTISTNNAINNNGRLLLESLSGLDLVLAPLLNSECKYPVTCKANDRSNSVEGGSVIDFAFVSLQLYRRLQACRYAFERELSSHAWIELTLCVDSVPVAEETTSSYPRRTVMNFDVDRLLELSHTDDLVSLATNPDEFTVEEAYGTILDFVSMFTTTKQVAGGTQRQKLSARPHLCRIRQQLRRIERKMKKSRDVAVTEALEGQLKNMLEVYRAERDHQEQEQRTGV